jgi:hypothetical protein
MRLLRCIKVIKLLVHIFREYIDQVSLLDEAFSLILTANDTSRLTIISTLSVNALSQKM